MTTEQYNNSVDTHADGLYRFVLKNIKEEEKAKDIVQDTFEKLWIKVDNVLFEKVKSYLFTTAYHTMIDHIRKEKYQEDFEQVNPEKYSHNTQYTDVQEILHAAIEQLPGVQRSVLLLRDYEGYAYKEISDITRLSEAQVKVYIYRARLFLRNYIGKLEVII